MAGRFKVQLTGDWERLRHTINYLNNHYRRDAILLLQDQAERVKPAIEDKVFTLTGKPYDPRRPHNTGIWWIETMELITSLEVKRVAGGDCAFFVGFDGYHSDNQTGMILSNQEIAEKNEANHPLIAPTWQELEAEFKQEWQELVLKATRGGV